MIKKILKWTLRITALIFILLGLLIGVVLTPSLLYAEHANIGNFTVYHTKPLDKEFRVELDEASTLLKASEIYDPNFKIDICLNDGSKYPTLIQLFQEQAFGIGFYNKVIIMGNINIKKNYTVINGYNYNLVKLIAHEAIHCFQFNKLGLQKSNPIAKYPDWKWDGYNEYVSRRDQANLVENIKHLEEAIKADKNEWGINFTDSTFVGRNYYSWWILMQYCKDYKKLSYQEILDDTTKEVNLRTEMMTWYRKQIIN